MALTTTIINNMITTIKEALVDIYPCGDTYLSAVDYLDTDISISTPDFVSYPQKIDLSWGSASSGSVSTANLPSSSNPLNFSVKGGDTAKTIVFTNNSTVKQVTAVMDLSSDVVGGTYGSGLYLERLRITLSEE